MTVDHDGEFAKVSEFVTVKIGIPNSYSNVEVSFGMSRPCDNNPLAIRQMATTIHKLNKQIIEKRAQEYLTMAQEMVDNA